MCWLDYFLGKHVSITRAWIRIDIARPKPTLGGEMSLIRIIGPPVDWATIDVIPRGVGVISYECFMVKLILISPYNTEQVVVMPSGNRLI